MNQDNGSNVNVWFFLGIYAAIGLGSSAFTVIQTIILWVFCAIRSAKNLHHDMLKGVFRFVKLFIYSKEREVVSHSCRLDSNYTVNSNLNLNSRSPMAFFDTYEISIISLACVYFEF